MIYQLNLSNVKDYINITEEEYEKIKKNISANFIEIKYGLINPSYIVSITIDREASRQEKLYDNKNKQIEAPKSQVDICSQKFARAFFEANK